MSKTKAKLNESVKQPIEITAQVAEEKVSDTQRLSNLIQDILFSVSQAATLLAVPAAYLEGAAKDKKADPKFDAIISSNDYIKASIGNFKTLVANSDKRLKDIIPEKTVNNDTKPV